MTLREPPKEFRIFKRGWNYTTKGDALFDDAAAKLVMAEYAHHGVDGVIDLEHLSTNPESPNYDPDARGWYKLQVRKGELWAINCTWTPDGARRLRDATQRYVSPFFFLGEKSRRIVALYNVAICASPATDDAPALVAAIAASKRADGTTIAATNIGDNMDFKKMVCSMLGLKEDTPDEDVIAAVKALQEPEGDDEPETAETSDEPNDDPKKAEKDADDPDKKVEESLSSLPPMVQAVLRAKLGKSDAIETRLKTLEARTTKSEVEALLASNTAKFTKKQETWLRKQTVEVVSEFLAHADPIHREPAKEPIREPGARGAQAKTTEEIEAIAATEADRAIAKATGEKLETIVAGRKADAKKRNLRLAQG